MKIDVCSGVRAHDHLPSWHSTAHVIMFVVFALSISFQKSSLITLSLIVITCCHDNSLIGAITHLSLSSSFSFFFLAVSLLLLRLLLFIFFVVTPTHPSTHAITHFNFSTGDFNCSLYQNDLLFFFFLSFSELVTSGRETPPAKSRRSVPSLVLTLWEFFFFFFACSHFNTDNIGCVIRTSKSFGGTGWWPRLSQEFCFKFSIVTSTEAFSF